MAKTFQSQYPILEACMNKGSTVELAVAVHQAGGYPSLCSWTYNGRYELLQRDLDRFVKETGSNRIHISFELYEYPTKSVHDIVKSHAIPTVEIIYGARNTFRPTVGDEELLDDLLELVTPLRSMNSKIFRRIYEPMDQFTMDQHLLDGFCIKGAESAGFSSYTPVKELFLTQRQLTPNALLIPYGGVGTAQQVKEYMDLGAEMVAVGTLLALSAESSLSLETKKNAIRAQRQDLVEFKHRIADADRKQNALEFQPYQGPDDANGTTGLVRGIHGKKSGHVYLGHGIDHVTDILTCQQIIKNLTLELV